MPLSSSAYTWHSSCHTVPFYFQQCPRDRLSVQSLFKSSQYKNSGAKKNIDKCYNFQPEQIAMKIMQSMNCKYILILQLQWLMTIK